MAVRGLVSSFLLCAAFLCPFGMAALAQEDDSALEKVPLPIELPQPSFGGTPLDYHSEHLEPPSFRKRAPFLAPKGAKNVALKKRVTASVKKPQTGQLSQIVDGHKGFQQAFLVELPDGAQWIQIDLGAEHEVYAVVVWHYHAADRVYFDVVVKTALDVGLTKDVKTHYNNDHDNSSGLGAGKNKEYVESFQGRLMDAKGAHARYVRLYTNGNTSNELNHYIEVEIWGKPVGE